MASSAQPVNTQSCDATLTIGRRKYEGATGNDKGHAEMTALDAFITDQGGVANAVVMLMGDFKKQVSCPSRPVCLKCGAVLQKLGFVTDQHTKWGSKTMGSTEWGVTLNVRALLKAMGHDYEEIRSLTS